MNFFLYQVPTVGHALPFEPVSLQEISLVLKEVRLYVCLPAQLHKMAGIS